MEKNDFKDLSTQQANQLRIALITISLGLTAFLSSNIDNGLNFATNRYLVISVVTSSLAVVCGLLAWKFSAKMFYDMGNGIHEGINHKLKDIFDFSLGVFLIVAVILSATYLVVERKPTQQNQVQPTAEIRGH
jgi:RsiW-degrading membrane proteinase PrsW (M82 family)